MQLKMIQRLEMAITQTERIAALGDGPALNSYLRELRRYKSIVLSHWPLTAAEKASVDINRVAERELDDVHPEYVALLARLAASLRQE
jgi:hypothetical protein